MQPRSLRRSLTAPPPHCPLGRYTLLEQVQFHGFSLSLVRKWSEALLKSLAFLARDDVRVIHTDIKPENICIRNPRRSAIKLIDFGSACHEGKQIFSYIQSRYYRSPEVLLSCGYTVAIDTWSLACVLVEMHVGAPLFSGENQVDQVRKIMEVMGKPPDAMIDCWAEEKRSQVFAPGGPGGPKWVPLDPGAVGSKSLDTVLGTYTGGPHGRWGGEAGHGPNDYAQFRDVILRMLALEPSGRLTPLDALRHPFITQEYDGSQARLRQQAKSMHTESAQHAAQRREHHSSGGGGGAGIAGGESGESSSSSLCPEQHRMEISRALTEIGCPSEDLRRPLNWDSIAELLEQFTAMDSASLQEAKARFTEFINQPLRARQKKALAHLLDLLREPSNVRGAAAMMETERADSQQTSSTPIP